MTSASVVDRISEGLTRAAVTGHTVKLAREGVVDQRSG